MDNARPFAMQLLMTHDTRLPSIHWIPFTSATALLCAGTWLWLAIDVGTSPAPEPWELAVFTRVMLWRPAPLDGSMPFIDEIVDFAVLIGLLAFTWKAAARKTRDWIELGTLWAVALGGVVLAFGLKQLIDRPRPGLAVVIDNSSSFPSGHTMAASLIAGYAMYVTATSTLQTWAKLSAQTACVSAILLVAYSRVFVGAHYPADVVAAILAAAAWLCTCIGVSAWFRRNRHRLTRSA